MTGRVLIIAGSDSGGGAGIQADIKTVTMLGGYAATAITALTAQNSLGVHGVHPVPPAFVQQQIQVVLDDIGADAIKIGMLGSAAMVDAVADALSAVTCPVVLDPVMVAKGGAALLEPEAIARLKARLISRAMLLTPNLPEAEALCGTADPALAGPRLLDAGATAVLIKGGHAPGDKLEDWLWTRAGSRCFRSLRIQTRHTHGTGCTLASAIATGLAQGMALEVAINRAAHYVQAAIAHAPGLGGGHGPLGHAPPNWQDPA